MIRLGIVGSNYGRLVQTPAFRTDPRCEVVAIAGSDFERTAALARELAIPRAFGDWAQLVAAPGIDAVAIAVPPRLQPAIALRALALGKPVFAEKPLAADLGDAQAMLQQAEARGFPTLVDFNFTEILPWKQARTMLAQGAIGRLRHVVVTWNVENAAVRFRTKNWKTDGAAGGGALGNFVSHCLHYLEWFCGPLTSLVAQTSALPDDATFQTGVTLACIFRSGANGSLVMNCGSFLGSGHRLEFYGEDGTLVLANSTTDHMRGFAIAHARRPAEALAPVQVEPDPLQERYADGRVAPVARLAQRFLDAIEQHTLVEPGFSAGCRVQVLLDAVQRACRDGRRIDLAQSQ